MTNQNTKDFIRSYLKEHFPIVRKRNLSDEEALLQGGIVDSMGILDLVAQIEEQFGITVCDEDLVPENFENIAAIAGFIESKQGYS